MRVVILAGGKGTRLGEHTQGLIPKPMVTVGGIPILAHIMSIYIDQGMREFVVAAGHLAEAIRVYQDPAMSLLNGLAGSPAHSMGHKFRCIVSDTGEDTGTAGRLRKVRGHLGRGDTFLMTYGDGLADVNLQALLDHHRRMRADHGVLVTLTAAHPPARFGTIIIRDGLCTVFGEKSQDPSTWISAGFFVMEKGVLDFVHSDSMSLEYDILPILAHQGRLAVYQHPGYFQMLDTPRDLAALEEASKHQPPPWASWRTKTT